LTALDAASIVEALPAARVKRTPASNGARIGMLDVDADKQGRHFVWVFDLAAMVSGRAAAPRADGQVILLRHGFTTVGLLVDDVHSVQRFPEDASTPIGLGDTGLSAGLIQANGGALLIQELSAERIVQAAMG